MIKIAKLALMALRNVNPSNDLSSDIVVFLEVCVIGWVGINRIYNNHNYPEYFESDFEDLKNELEHINVSSLVDEFLKSDFSGDGLEE